MTGRIVQINVNPQGGPLKNRVQSARLTFNGVEGDKQNNLRYHGGPMRAVCLFSWEIIRDLQDEGHPVDGGTTGENLTLSGLEWAKLKPGVRLKIGDEAELEITDYTVPCFKIKASFIDGQFKRISQKLHPGQSRLYAKVLVEGVARENDEVEVRED